MSDKVASIVIEKVPCAFAPVLKDGSIGLHEIKAVFGHKGEILRVHSECQSIHGAGIDGIYELAQESGAQQPLCYNAIRDVYENFETMRALGDQGLIISVGDLKQESPKPGSVFHHAVQAAFACAVNDHNTRHTDNRRSDILLPARFERKIERLYYKLTQFDHIVQTISRNALKTSYVPFKVTLGEGTDLDKRQVCLRSRRDNRILATRAAATGAWVLDQDVVKSFASTRENIRRIDRRGTKTHPNKEEECIFCGESFSRLSKHTSGAKHLQHVIDFVNLLCKALSPAGLRMLNNPKYKDVFLRRG